MSGTDLAAIDEELLHQTRIDLAAAFRLAVHFNWHESVGNHFSAAVSRDGKAFLMNPKWRHFGAIRASDLQLLHADDTDTMTRDDAPDITAWTVHGSIHRAVPSARVLLHCHPKHATALACLKDPEMKPIDQNTARFHGITAIDLAFGGMADDAEEGMRLARAFGNHQVMMMGNHGVTVAADSVPMAFELLYFFERAAETLLTAYASGQPLNVMCEEIAARTAESWKAFEGMAAAHFDYLKAMLDRTDSSWRH